MIMPETFDLDIATFVRICLNDSSVRDDITAALAAGPLPVRDTLFAVKQGDTSYAARVRTDRNKSPGDAGFLVRDGGRLVGTLVEAAMTSDHAASTMSAEQLAKSLGITVAELEERAKKPKI
jgi:hypothetical protein